MSCHMFQWVTRWKDLSHFSGWWSEGSCHIFEWLMRWNCLTDIDFTEWWGEMSFWLLHISVNDMVKCPCYCMFQWVVKWNVLSHISVSDKGNVLIVACFIEGCEMFWLLQNYFHGQWGGMSWLLHISVNCLMQNSVTVMCWQSEMSWLLHISVNCMMPNLRLLCTDQVKYPGCSSVQRMMRCSALIVLCYSE